MFSRVRCTLFIKEYVYAVRYTVFIRITIITCSMHDYKSICLCVNEVTFMKEYVYGMRL